MEVSVLSRLTTRYLTTFLVFALLFSSSFAPLCAAPATQSNNTATTTPSQNSIATASTNQNTANDSADSTEETVDEKKKGKELSSVMNNLLLAVAGSPVLMKVIATQLKKHGNQKMASWARESYYIVGQAVSIAEQTGAMSSVQGQKAKLYQDQFGKIMKEAGWLDKMAMRSFAGNEKQAIEAAAHQGRRIARRTFEGEVANLQGERIITDLQAKEFLGIKSRGIMTPRELGGFLLSETNLTTSQTGELLRTYRATRADDGRVRISGGRDSRYDTAVLDLLENWQGKRHARFSSQTTRKLAAKYLTFQGSVEDFSKLVMSDGNLSGPDSARLVDEFAMEAAKDQSHFGKKATLKADVASQKSHSRKKNTVNEAPKATSNTAKTVSSTDASPKASASTNSAPKATSNTVKTVSSTDTSPKASASTNSVEFKHSRSAVSNLVNKSGKTLNKYGKEFNKLGEKVSKFGQKIAAESGWKEVKASATSKDGFLGYKGKWTGGGIDGVKQSLKYDAFRGGIFVDVGISAATGIIARLKSGASFKESVGGTLSTIASTEFIFGDILGGVTGAALGAAIPLPAALQTMGAFGKFFGVLPGVSLAIAGSQFGYGAVSLMKRGQFSLSTLFHEVKPGLVIGQAIGAAVGMTVGSLLLPGPIGAMLGGIVGGMIGSKIATILFGYKQDEALAQISHTTTLNKADVGSEVSAALQGVNIQYPDSDDMQAIDKAVKDAYSAYIRANKSGDYEKSASCLRTYSELQKVLQSLINHGYRVK